MDIIGQNGNDGLHYEQVEQEAVEIPEDPARDHELELYEEIYQETTPVADDSGALDEYQEYTDAQVPTHIDNETAADPEKVARRVWKTQNPDQTIKEQESLYERGVIDELPWEHLAARIDDKEFAHVDFGTKFPANPSRGDTYIRVDFLPTKLYKYNGNKWIEIDKNVSDSFTYNDDYIDHLIAKIGSGEYDPELLNDSEREQITERLKNQDI